MLPGQGKNLMKIHPLMMAPFSPYQRYATLVYVTCMAGTTSMPMNKNPSMRTAKARLRQLAASSSATGSVSPYSSFMTQD